MPDPTRTPAQIADELEHAMKGALKPDRLTLPMSVAEDILSALRAMSAEPSDAEVEAVSRHLRRTMPNRLSDAPPTDADWECEAPYVRAVLRAALEVRGR